MAASSHGVGDLGELSTNLGLPSEEIASLANRSEECTTLLLKMKNYCKGQVSKEEKYRSEIASLRRARVNAGLTLSYSLLFPLHMVDFS